MKLLYNATVYTFDQSQPKVSAVLLDGGRILAVGEKDALEAMSHGRVEKQDMQGKTILPGLTDAHFHFQYYALSLAKIDCETKTKGGMSASRGGAGEEGEARRVDSRSRLESQRMGILLSLWERG